MNVENRDYDPLPKGWPNMTSRRKYSIEFEVSWKCPGEFLSTELLSQVYNRVIFDIITEIKGKVLKKWSELLDSN